MNMNLHDILKFKGVWRTYQERVLSRTDKYLSDGKMHIVAAPGSGKTTLGIEIIARVGKPTLILAPTITIREQWISRIEDGFLLEGIDAGDYLSQDLRVPKAITVATYQALHRAMTRARGKASVEESAFLDVEGVVSAGNSDDLGGQGNKKAVRSSAKKVSYGGDDASKERYASNVASSMSSSKIFESYDMGADDENYENDRGEEAVYSETDSENLDYSGFEMIKTAKDFGFGTICLDECHHLRNEWWKALEDFKKSMGSLIVIALTATPPYDSLPSLWKRYIDMCGEIDEEITVPELVKEGSLCPHQDYVYFNYPTVDETKLIGKYEERATEMMGLLMKDETFERCVRSHPALRNLRSADEMLEHPARLSAMLIFLKSKGIEFPDNLKTLLGAKTLPNMELKWMEILLQTILYDDPDSFTIEEIYIEGLENRLKQRGLIERRTVCLVGSSKVKKALTHSLGKCESIKKIVAHEYESMGKDLRLLVLTDFIRKQYEAVIGDNSKDVTALGVLPFFEQLRRAGIGKHQGFHGEIRLGVLCGSIVIIPAEAQRALLNVVGDGEKVRFSSVGALSTDDYVKVSTVGDSHFLTAAVTEIFSQGYIQALVGTKSLLGEGWDSPSINSLILASFVGSFMLSNQMRGRAIRVEKNNPNKTSNIWHLVCLNRAKEQNQENLRDALGEDFLITERRLDHFLGLDYEEDYIETGIDRLKLIKPPFTENNTMKINKAMLSLSSRRQELKSRWDKSLEILNGFEIADEVGVNKEYIPRENKSIVLFYDAIVSLAISIAITVIKIVGIPIFYADREINFGFLMELSFIVTGVLLTLCVFRGTLNLLTPLRRLKTFGKAIYQALKDGGYLESEKSKVDCVSSAPYHVIYLNGGTRRDKAVFAKCVSEFFDDIDNQRYILVRCRSGMPFSGYFAVPELLSKRKEDANLLASCVSKYAGKYAGKYDAVYTRSVEGRKLLMKGRRRALANTENSIIQRKKRVKSELE